MYCGSWDVYVLHISVIYYVVSMSFDVKGFSFPLAPCHYIVLMGEYGLCKTWRNSIPGPGRDVYNTPDTSMVVRTIPPASSRVTLPWRVWTDTNRLQGYLCIYRSFACNLQNNSERSCSFDSVHLSSQDKKNGGILENLLIYVLSYRLPLMEWCYDYQVTTFFSDLNAGVTVFVLLIPQALAYAVLTDVPPVYGLYTSTAALFVYAVFGYSRQLAIGPMAITSLLSSAAVSELGYDSEDDENRFVSATISMALYTGVLLVLMGIFQLGFLTNFLSSSVLTGFVTGSAAVIALSQLPYVLGISIERKEYSHQIIYTICTHLDKIHIYGLVIGITTTILLHMNKQWRQTFKAKSALRSSQPNQPPFTTWQRIEKKILYPLSNVTSLLAVIVTTAISFAIHKNSSYTLPIVGEIPQGFKTPAWPSMNPEVLPGAIMISVISYAGNWAVAKKFAYVNNYDISASGELISAGLSNIASSVFNGFVVAGGLARTAVNAEAGAQTPLAGAITGSFIIFALLFLTSLFYYLPMATLGAIIEVSVVTMMDFESIGKAFSYKCYPDFAIMIVTALCTFFVGISYGLLTGVALSVGIPMYHAAFPIMSRSSISRPGDGDSTVDDEDSTQSRLEHISGRGASHRCSLPYVIVRMTAPLFFANTAAFSSEVDTAAAVLVKSLSSDLSHGDDFGPAVDSKKDADTVNECTDEEEFLPTSHALPTLAVIIDASCWGRYLDLPSVNAIREACSSVASKYKGAAQIQIGFVNVHLDVQLTLEQSGVLCAPDSTDNRASIPRSMVFDDVHHCSKNCEWVLKKLSAATAAISESPSVGENGVTPTDIERSTEVSNEERTNGIRDGCIDGELELEMVPSDSTENGKIDDEAAL